MSWSKRRKKFNKTFDPNEHHKFLIRITVTKLIQLYALARLEYHMLYGYPPYEGAPKYVTPPIIKDLEERLRSLMYGQ